MPTGGISVWSQAGDAGDAGAPWHQGHISVEFAGREGTQLPGTNLVTVLRSAVRGGGGGGGVFAQRRLSLERSWRPSALCPVSRRGGAS